jgi:hypothetical protein
MVEEHALVGVVVEKAKAQSQWIDEIWRPAAILSGAPDAPAWTLLERQDDRELWYVGAFTISLYSTDTANYRDNLATGAPRLWIAARPEAGEHPLEIVGVTCDPAEGESYTEAGEDVVEAVPMPADIAARVAAFVEAHHVEREFFKRKRDRANPEALARRGPAGPGGGRDR